MAAEPGCLWSLLCRADAPCVEDWSEPGPPRCLTLAELRHAAQLLAARLHWAPRADAHRKDDAGADEARRATPPRGAVVSILADVGVEVVGGMVASVRALRPFLLLDPALPTERLQYQIEDTGSGTLLVPCGRLIPMWASHVASLRSGQGCISVDVPDLLHASGDCHHSCHSHAAEVLTGVSTSTTAPSELAYVCYTSGSTGRPKGVAVSPEALRNYALANAQAHNIKQGSRVLLASAVSFDPAIGEAWTALATEGARLLLPSRRMIKEMLGRSLRRLNVTHVCTTPALWAMVDTSEVAEMRLECVALGGEVMPARLLRRWAATVGLYNVYGVTECTVYQCSRRISPRVALPANNCGLTTSESGIDACTNAIDDGSLALEASLLGQPLGGCTIYLLDDSLRNIPATLMSDGQGTGGLVGQVAIGGDQLACGYVGMEELTRSRFVVLPLGNGCSMKRVYLTGDLGRWEGGSLRLLGRADRQVKLNGIRFELDEVEAAILRSPLVAAVSVVLVDNVLLGAVELHSSGFEVADSGDMTRVEEGGYCRGADCSDNAVRSAMAALLLLECRRWLPSQACPARLLLLRKLPLTPTGKVDRQEVSRFLRAESEAEERLGAAREPAVDALEQIVCATWMEVLSVPHVHRQSDFLALGGDSIRALQVSRFLSKRLSHTASVAATRGASLAANADEADYGLLQGTFSALALLRRPVLCKYAEYLRASGVGADQSDFLLSGTKADSEGKGGFCGSEDLPAPEAIGTVEEAVEDEAVAEAAAATSAAEEAEREVKRLSSELGAAVEADEQRSAEARLLQQVLCIAAGSGRLTLAKAALALGADPAPRPPKKRRGTGAVNESGLSPLHLASREGHDALVNLLLAASAPPTLLSSSGAPALHVAAESRRGLLAIQPLIDGGAPLAMRDDRRQTALHAASRRGRCAAVQVLLNAKIDVELRDRWHRTALHWAVVNRHAEVVTLLIAAGASVNGVPIPVTKHAKSTSLPLECPLHSASRHPPAQAALLIRLLTQAAADPNRVDQFGQTPLHVAVAYHEGERSVGGRYAVEALLDAGAKPHMQDRAGRTPAMLASSNEVRVTIEQAICMK